MHYAVIMAGGAGTRLWPAARQRQPKQLQRLIFQRPLIAETVHRLSGQYPMERILVVTADRYADPIREVVPELPPENVISEPVGRNTAAAIALTAMRIARDDPDGVFAVFPADHVILRPEALFAALDYANELALHHKVVDIGVPATQPETGYGYIEMADEIGMKNGIPAHAVRRFIEKPDLQTAREYVVAGNYMWNSGMFIWRATEYLSALQQHLPDTYDRLKPAYDSGMWEALAEAYSQIQNISVDYAIMENVSDVVALPVDFGWRDIGDWAALYDMMEHDEHGNASDGKHVLLDTRNSLLLSPRKMIATIGVHDMIVVDTDDVLLLMPRHRAQDVKQILSQLEEMGEGEIL
jgi:mannose-1-phosphate guanylyltransferase